MDVEFTLVDRATFELPLLAEPMPSGCLGKKSAASPLCKSSAESGQLQGEAHPAVAHHDRRHPMKRGGLHPVAPGRLTVIVGVNVHEARSDDLASRIDLLDACLRDAPDGRHATVLDGHIGLEGRSARSADDDGATDDEIVSLAQDDLQGARVVSGDEVASRREPRSSEEARRPGVPSTWDCAATLTRYFTRPTTTKER